MAVRLTEMIFAFRWTCGVRTSSWRTYCISPGRRELTSVMMSELVPLSAATVPRMMQFGAPDVAPDAAAAPCGQSFDRRPFTVSTSEAAET